MGKVFKFVFQVLISVILIFLFAAGIIALDGSVDQGHQADVGLVLASSPPQSGNDPLLDRAAKLYTRNAFTTIFVSSIVTRQTEQPEAMAKYLEAHGVPHDVIVQVPARYSTPEIAQSVAAEMKTRQLKSVIIVADYYRIMLVKVALYHNDVAQIGKAHIGKINPNDFPAITHETIDFYRYVAINYLLPAVEKIRQETKVGSDQLKVDADQAKKKVDNALDGLAK